MRAIVQRVSQASVTVEEKIVGEIGQGLLVLIAAAKGDGLKQCSWMAEKLVGLRIFSDEHGKMNLSLDQVQGEMLIVSQFTLYGDMRKGKRPSYSEAMGPGIAKDSFDRFTGMFKEKYSKVQTGIFGADMEISLTNSGPVTIIIDSNKIF